MSGPKWNKVVLKTLDVRSGCELPMTKSKKIRKVGCMCQKSEIKRERKFTVF